MRRMHWVGSWRRKRTFRTSWLWWGQALARFRSEFESMDEQVVEKEKTLSRIADLDMAMAASRLARLEVRMQATTSVFVQANRIFDQRNYVEELLL